MLSNQFKNNITNSTIPREEDLELIFSIPAIKTSNKMNTK